MPRQLDRAGVDLFSAGPVEQLDAARHIEMLIYNEGSAHEGSPHHGLWQAEPAEAFTKCHNEHNDSPRTDFDLGEVMGGVVIRIPIDS